MRIHTRVAMPIATHSLTFCLVLLASGAVAQDRDTDGDSLSDFQERHKYFTDPGKADSDGDGTPDGDWLERREFTYTVRAVVLVMKPVTAEHLNDDYQDARVLDETGNHVELEVIHYPFNTVTDAIQGNRAWRQEASRMKEWLDPGPTSDWTPGMRKVLALVASRHGQVLNKSDLAAPWASRFPPSPSGWVSSRPQGKSSSSRPSTKSSASVS